MDQLAQAIAAVPSVRLGSLPTPLERLHRLEQHMGVSHIYIKRDDLTGLGPGGNKIRSLEFLLGEAVAQRCDLVVAAGPVQSNLCTLTAACANKLGMDCILLHNGAQPEQLQGNLLLNQLLGAESIFLGSVDSSKRALAMEDLLQVQTQAGRRPYAVRNGATTGLGAMGYASAIAELRTQCTQQGIESLTIFAPGGNGGVAAGLIYGNQLLGNPFSLVIISVEDDSATLTQHIEQTIAETVAITGVRFSGSVSKSACIVDTYRGAGWGMNTPQSSQAIPDFARLEGILLENVYTSKVLVGMCDFIRKGKVDSPACYLHTGGLGSLFSQYNF
ncbi:MAG: 1-aminocyclopropane-1-carboxylate deaminase/D-cysteine desulfhydrase [Candidatus Fimivivens sp.]